MKYYHGDYVWEEIDDPGFAQRSIDEGATIYGNLPDGTPVEAKRGRVWKRCERYRMNGRLLYSKIQGYLEGG